MADEGVIQGGAGAADGASAGGGGSLESRLAGALPPEPQQAPVSGGPTTQGASALGQVAQQQPGAGVAGGETQYQGLLEYSKANGVPLPFKDDTSAYQGLIQAYRQLQQRNYYADVGQRIAPHAQQFQEFLRQREQQTAQTQAAQPKPWAAPPYKREWLQMVETDESTGQLRSKPGYDPAIADRVTAYAEWRDKFLQSPDEVLKPWVAAEAQQIVQAQMATYEESRQADSLVQREASWMFQGGQRGNPLTVAGQMYNRVTDELWAGGLRDVRQLHRAGVSAVQNAFLRQQAQAQTASQAVASRTPAQQAQTPLSVAGAIVRHGSSGAIPPARQDTQPNMSLHQRLMKKTAGIME